MEAIARAILNQRPIVLTGKQIKEWVEENWARYYDEVRHLRWHFKDLKDARYYKIFYLPLKIGRNGKPCPRKPQVRRVHDADITEADF